MEEVSTPPTDGQRLQYIKDELDRRPASEDAAQAFGELVGEIVNRARARARARESSDPRERSGGAFPLNGKPDKVANSPK